MHLQEFIDYLSYQKRFSAHSITAYSKDLETFWEYANKEGYTALHLCAFISFKREIARMLIDAGADVNIQQGYDGKTALMNFILYGENDIVELILERPDVDVNIKSNEGNTAWSLASRTIRKRFPKLKPTE